MRARTVMIAALLVCGVERAGARVIHAGPFLPLHLRLARGTLVSLSATPGTIAFRAADPDLGTVSGSAPGNVTWMVLSGSRLKTWTVSLQASSSSFVGCPAIPVSAIRVTCSAATVSSGGGTGACSGSLPLSTTPQQIAAGSQGDGTGSYSVSLNFTLMDSWQYIANPACSLAITYLINAP